MWLLRLKQRDEYSFDHAMDVAVNMVLVGTHIDITTLRNAERELQAALHDLDREIAQAEGRPRARRIRTYAGKGL